MKYRTAFLWQGLDRAARQRLRGWCRVAGMRPIFAWALNLSSAGSHSCRACPRPQPRGIKAHLEECLGDRLGLRLPLRPDLAPSRVDASLRAANSLLTVMACRDAILAMVGFSPSEPLAPIGPRTVTAVLGSR